jgi:hypothetical protein
MVVAYADGDVLFTVEGNLPGGEVWANVWAKTGGPAAALEGLTADLVAFYENQEDDRHTGWTVERVTAKDLFSGDIVEQTITPFNGNDSTNAPLPVSTAVRVSLSALGGVRGGPFLSGYTAGALSAVGQLDITYRNRLVTELDALDESWNALDGSQVGIHRPTTETVVAVTTARVGLVFDVIRGRRNALAESYAVVTF